MGGHPAKPLARHRFQPTGAPTRTRSVLEGGKPILTVARQRHGSGQREVGGGPAVPIIVALSEGYRVERRTRAGVVRKSPSVGAVTVANPSERTLFTVEGRADVLQLLVPLGLLEGAADGPDKPVQALFNEHDPAIERAALGALVALMRDDGHSELLLASVAYQLAGRLVGYGHAGERLRCGGIRAPALRRIHDLVWARLGEPIPRSPPLIELAEAAGLSAHHFIKAFRQTVGETPYAWVLRQRIERARALLIRPDETVSNVAFQTGFSSPAHFVDVFRRRLGLTPGAFQEAVLG